jgi:polyhydroxybutyrate depolymerase
MLPLRCIALALAAAPFLTPRAIPAMELRSVPSGGMTRWYRVHVPDDYDPNQSTPVILAFHGGGGDARQFADHTQLWMIADREDFLLVFPEGTGALAGPPFFLLETWNAGDCCGWAENHNVDDVQFTRDMVAALASEWNVDLQRVFATGHSNGGMMSYRLGIEAPDLVRAIAPNAASLEIGGLPPAPVPLLVMHGQLDCNVPYQGGVGCGVSGTHVTSQRASVRPFWLANLAQAPVLAETRGSAHRYEMTAPVTGAPIRYWWMTDHGHAWPGHGSGGLPNEPCNFDIDANDELWAFFSQF